MNIQQQRELVERRCSKPGKTGGIVKRKAISKKLRFSVFHRDEFACQYCGATPLKAALQIDHIVPVAGGGGNEIDNLITACQPCNAGKGATSLNDVPQSLKDRAAIVSEREEQIRAYNEVMREKRQREEGEAWEVAELFMRQFRKDGIRSDYFNSILVFIEKIGLHECVDAMNLALFRKGSVRAHAVVAQDYAFRYFCGICWNKARDQ